MKLNLFNILIFISIISASIFIDNRLYYIGFAYICLAFINQALKSKALFKSVFYITLYSVTLPDNYTILALSVVLFLLAVSKMTGSIRIRPYFLLFSIGLICSAAINRVPVINIVLYLIFNSLFWIGLGITGETHLDTKEKITSNLLNIVYIQLFSSLCILLKAYLFNQPINPDNFSGTYVRESSYIFASIITMICIYLISDFLGGIHKKKYGILIALCMIATLMSSVLHVTASLILAAAIYLTMIYSVRTGKLFRTVLIYFPMLLFIGYLFISVFQKELLQELGRMLGSYEALAGRINKIGSYVRVFFEIPIQDQVFLFFGRGPGYFSSRAAFTATGIYIDLYNKLGLPVSVSDYTAVFILPNYYLFKPGLTNGVEDFPYSSIISIMGETGIIGLGSLCMLLFKDLRSYLKMGALYKKYYFACFSTLFFFILCFWDNYIEYGKVVFIFIVIRYLFTRSFDEEEEVRLNG